MNNRHVIVALTILGCTALPTQAQDWPELNKESVGKGIGAVTGAIIGSKIGGGHGRTAAIAAGTLAGYWAGGQVGRHYTEAGQKSSRPARAGHYSSNSNLKPALNRLPPIELVNAYYFPTTDINVRGGPGTDYAVSHTIRQGKRVPVAGRVVGSEWYLIAEQGKASGFLYAPLMVNDHGQSAHYNAIREASITTQYGRTISQSPTCRTITQEVSLSNGSREPQTFQACQQANGNWVKI
jgi:uncharacterized protein YgiM (DUF1202 family)